MKTIIFTMIGLSILFGCFFLVLNGGLKKIFSVDPASPYYKNRPMVETQSEKTQDLREHQENMMDNLRSKIEKNQQMIESTREKMERLKHN